MVFLVFLNGVYVYWSRLTSKHESDPNTVFLNSLLSFVVIVSNKFSTNLSVDGKDFDLI